MSSTRLDANPWRANTRMAASIIAARAREDANASSLRLTGMARESIHHVSSRIEAIVRVHHLNCGTMCPWAVGELCCHCLLCETRWGLVLVETGFGSGDIAQPQRLGRAVKTLARAHLDRSETALARIEA